MKKNFLFALLGIVAMLTSCNKEEVGGLATNKATSFNVSVDGGVKTRATVTDLTRYVMEIYKGATATGTPEVHKEQATGVFTDVVLDNAQQYTVLFWADYGTPSTDGTHPAANEYNASNLKAAQVAASKQPTKAAYSGVSKFTVGTTDESVYTAVTLTHAVAQVNFVQTENLTSATNTLAVSYPESYSLNVDGNAVTKINGAITHNFTFNQKAKGTLGTSYIIAASGTPKTVLEVTATLNSETAIAVSNVPFERNFRTNISGAYSSKYEAALTVTCDGDWGTPDNEAELPKEEPSLTWATGNLIADGVNGAKIGAPTDAGLFFQFGSLVGWSTTGSPAIVVKPVGYTGSTWWDGSWTGDPATENAATGTGDPCKYYLKDTWRLPTNDEYAELFNNNGYPSTGPWKWANSSATNTTLNLTLPASGFRLGNSGALYFVGTDGSYWSASPDDALAGYYLYFSSSSVYPSLMTNRASGLPIRCVK